MQPVRRSLSAAVFFVPLVLATPSAFGQVPSGTPPAPSVPTAPLASAAPPATVPMAGPPGVTRPVDLDDPTTIPLGYRVETQRRKGLLTAGLVGFGVGWLSAVVAGGICTYVSTAGESGGNAATCAPLFVPLVGPFVLVGTAERLDAVGGVLITVNGIVQVAGATLTILGLTLPEKKLVPIQAPPTVQMAVAPVIAEGRFGLSLVGTF